MKLCVGGCLPQLWSHSFYFLRNLLLVLVGAWAVQLLGICNSLLLLGRSLSLGPQRPVGDLAIHSQDIPSASPLPTTLPAHFPPLLFLPHRLGFDFLYSYFCLVRCKDSCHQKGKGRYTKVVYKQIFVEHLLHARDCARSFPCVNSANPHNKPVS